MELWIRSQDREKLLKCNNIAITNNIVDKIDIIKFEGYKIVGYFDKNTEYENLGTYKTKERALEVLDEIQNLLRPIYKITNEFKKSELTGIYKYVENQEYIPIQSRVYKMPEK